MQIEFRNEPAKLLEDLSPEDVRREMMEALQNPEVKKVTVYPRYLVKHEGPNRRQRRAMARGKEVNGWREKDY